MVIPVITLWQPWCYMIEKGYKTIETRLHNRFQSLNGRTIGIHAGRTVQEDWEARCIISKLRRAEIKRSLLDPREGQIICLVDVYSFRKLTISDNLRAMKDCGEAQRYGLLLRNVKPFSSPKLTGFPGIWYYDTLARKKISPSRRNNQLKK